MQLADPKSGAAPTALEDLKAEIRSAFRTFIRKFYLALAAETVVVIAFTYWLLVYLR